MSPIEIVAVVLGLANVALVVRRSVWNYPFGIAMVLLYAGIFYESRLYSDALLQLFFFVVNVYGWWAWARSKAESGEVQVERADWPERLTWLGGCVAATAGWGWLMHRYTDAAYPWWDAGVAMASVAGQILMARRYLENWWLWIAADLLAIPLYAAKDLWPTSGLYVVFLGLSVWGALGWAGARRRVAA